MGFEDSPADNVEADREEYEAWEKKQQPDYRPDATLTPTDILAALDLAGRVEAVTGRSTARGEESQSQLRVTGFLETLYVLNLAGEVRRSLDYLIDFMDDALNEGRFAQCNAAFELADVERLDEAAIVAFLGITVAAKQYLPFRSAFYRSAVRHISATQGTDYANRLLSKYR